METWMVNEEAWSLPIAVGWPEQTDVAAVTVFTELPLLNIQRQALEAKLNSAGSYRDGTWWILRPVLMAMAQPAIEPEQQIVWRAIPPMTFRASPEVNRSEFITEYARTGIVNDPVKAEIIWVSFCKHGLSWMLNHQRPVPMGFCDLYAVPYRPNWKSFLFHMQQGKQTSGGKRILSDRQLLQTTIEKLIERGTADDLMDPKLIFWCKKDSHMYWSIEARPKNMWWRMIKAVEIAKKARRHGAVYLGSVGDTMKRLLPQTLELYASYLQQVTQPFVRLATATRRSHGKFARASRGFLARAGFSRSESAAYRGRRETGVVLDDVSSAAFVSTLSNLQREKLAMRDAREDLARPVAHVGDGDSQNGIPHLQDRAPS